MSDTDDDDGADEIFAAMQDACEGRTAIEVVYALGMMIALAVKQSRSPHNPDPIFSLLRKVVDIEMTQPWTRQ